ncbi:unnamed protein product [Arabidopsis thaliana]|uniref:Uncharacterized protein n=1 Tax=Arabidopsis thaliana TaxID=3702 RepID=Q9LHD0_ARATH|nr:unnamed protein product [Arabidopsis thaliana]
MLRYVKRSKSGKFDESDRVGDENENQEDDKAGEETMADCDKEECEKISKEDDVPVDLEKPPEISILQFTDPANWRKNDQGLKDYLVQKSSMERVERDYVFPKNDVAFRGTKEKIDERNNGNFLRFIETFEEFDSLTQEHIKRVKEDKSHKEQMSFVIRCVDVSTTTTRVEELFVTFLEVIDRSGKDFLSCFVIHSMVGGLTLKPLSETRWESRVESVQEIRFQDPKIRDALDYLAENFDDPKARSDADALATSETHGIGRFEFLFGLVIWYDLLFIVNTNLWMSSPSSSEKKAYHQKKMHFDEEVEKHGESVMLSEEESFKIDYFYTIVDQAIVSLQARFEQFEEYGKHFGFLIDLRKLKRETEDGLKASCINLETSLKHGKNSDK